MSREEALLEAIRDVAPEKEKEILDRAGQIEERQVGSKEPNPSVLFTPEEWREALSSKLTHEDVRRALSSIQGSLSDAVMAERDER